MLMMSLQRLFHFLQLKWRFISLHKPYTKSQETTEFKPRAKAEVFCLLAEFESSISSCSHDRPNGTYDCFLF